jgi:hypothetical protein
MTNNHGNSNALVSSLSYSILEQDNFDGIGHNGEIDHELSSETLDTFVLSDNYENNLNSITNHHKTHSSRNTPQPSQPSSPHQHPKQLKSPYIGQTLSNEQKMGKSGSFNNSSLNTSLNTSQSRATTGNIINNSNTNQQVGQNQSKFPKPSKIHTSLSSQSLVPFGIDENHQNSKGTSNGSSNVPHEHDRNGANTPISPNASNHSNSTGSSKESYTILELYQGDPPSPSNQQVLNQSQNISPHPTSNSPHNNSFGASGLTRHKPQPPKQTPQPLQQQHLQQQKSQMSSHSTTAISTTDSNGDIIYIVNSPHHSNQHKHTSLLQKPPLILQGSNQTISMGQFPSNQHTSSQNQQNVILVQNNTASTFIGNRAKSAYPHLDITDSLSISSQQSEIGQVPLEYGFYGNLDLPSPTSASIAHYHMFQNQSQLQHGNLQNQSQLQRNQQHIGQQFTSPQFHPNHHQQPQQQHQFYSPQYHSNQIGNNNSSISPTNLNTWQLQANNNQNQQNHPKMTQNQIISNLHQLQHAQLNRSNNQQQNRPQQQQQLPHYQQPKSGSFHPIVFNITSQPQPVYPQSNEIGNINELTQMRIRRASVLSNHSFTPSITSITSTNDQINIRAPPPSMASLINAPNHTANQSTLNSNNQSVSNNHSNQSNPFSSLNNNTNFIIGNGLVKNGSNLSSALSTTLSMYDYQYPSVPAPPPSIADTMSVSISIFSRGLGHNQHMNNVNNFNNNNFTNNIFSTNNNSSTQYYHHIPAPPPSAVSVLSDPNQQKKYNLNQTNGKVVQGNFVIQNQHLQPQNHPSLNFKNSDLHHHRHQCLVPNVQE